MFDPLTDLLVSTIEEMIVRSARRYVEARQLIREIPLQHPPRGEQGDCRAEASARPLIEIPRKSYREPHSGQLATSRRYKPPAGGSIHGMYPEFKDAEALDSVDDKSTGAQTLANDITKRVASRLVANCSKFQLSRLDQIQKYRDLYAGKVAKKFR